MAHPLPGSSGQKRDVRPQSLLSYQPLMWEVGDGGLWNLTLYSLFICSQAIKNPKVTLRYFQHLLGKQEGNPHVALYRARFPEHELGFDAQRQTVHFQISP